MLSSYDESMVYEKFLDNFKKDELYRRSNLGVNAGIVGNFLGLEIIKHLAGIGVGSLVGRIYVINFITMVTEFHTILRKPDCPHCGQKKI